MFPITTNGLRLGSRLFHNSATSTMSAFKLYGFRSSTNTDRVRLTLAEGGFTDYELVLLDLRKGEQKSEEHMKRHPWGKVPAVTFPDGFTLYESRAISRYLARKYSLPLLPADTDLESMALFDQAQSVEMLYFAEPATRIGYEMFAKKLRGLTPDETVVAAAVPAVESFFEVAERLLQDREYMAGNVFTLVDIFYVPLVRRLFVCGYGDMVSSRKAVSAWWDRCINRPAIRDMFAADEKAAGAAPK